MKHLTKLLPLLVLAASLSEAAEMPTLGKGYISNTGTLVHPCMVVQNSNVKYTGKNTANFVVVKDTSIENLYKTLNFSAAAKLTLEAISLDGQVEFGQTIAQDELSDSLVVSYQVRGKTAMVDGAKASEDALRFKNDKNEFYKHCGDSFVSAIELGADLNIGVKVTFMNREMKTKFGAEIKADLLELLTVQGRASGVVDKYKNKASITISAYQRGGAVSDLATILTSKKGDTYHIFRCGLDFPKPLCDKPSTGEGEERERHTETSSESCLIAIENILSYAKNEFPTQIAKMQVTFNTVTEAKPGEPKKTGGPAYISVSYKKYSEGGYSYLSDGIIKSVDAEIIKMRKNITTYYQNLRKKQNTIQALLRQGYLDELDEKQLEAQDLLATELLSQVDDAGESCFKFDPESPTAQESRTSCQNKYDALRIRYADAVSKFPKEGVSLHGENIKINTNFFHYCRMRKDDDQRISCLTVKRLVGHLLADKRSSVDEDDALYWGGQEIKDKFCSKEELQAELNIEEIHQCQEWYEVLKTQPTIDLSNYAKKKYEPIIDLNPLNGFKVQRLYARNNEIVDVSPLMFSGNKLRHLDLAFNRVTALDPLLFSPGIMRMDFTCNRLTLIEQFSTDAGSSPLWTVPKEGARQIILHGNTLREILYKDTSLDLVNSNFANKAKIEFVENFKCK